VDGKAGNARFRCGESRRMDQLDETASVGSAVTVELDEQGAPRFDVDLPAVEEGEEEPVLVRDGKEGQDGPEKEMLERANSVEEMGKRVTELELGAGKVQETEVMLGTETFQNTELITDTEVSEEQQVATQDRNQMAAMLDDSDEEEEDSELVACTKIMEQANLNEVHQNPEKAVSPKPQTTKVQAASLILHGPGRCCLSERPGGQYVLTGGADGVIKALKISNNTVARTTEYKKDAAVLGLDFHPNGELIAVGLANGEVQVLDHSSGELKLLASRLSGPVRDVCFRPVTGNELAIATSDHVIRIVDLEDTRNVSELKGHEGPIKCVRWDPHGEYLASSACDGQVRIWSRSDLKCVHIIKDALKKDPLEETGGTQTGNLAWSPDGVHLAITGRTDVQILERTTWAADCLTPEQFLQPSNFVSWSSNGAYLACSSEAGELEVWDIKSKTCLETSFEKSDAAITQSLQWSSKHNLLFAASIQGEVMWQFNCIPASNSGPNDAYASMSNSSSGADKQMGDTGEESKTISVNDIRMELGLQPTEGDEDDDEERANIRETLDMDHDDDSNEVEGDRRVYLDKVYTKEQVDDMLQKAISDLQPKPIIRQAAFQPSSTPVDAERRYLVWNSAGVIISRNEETFNSIEIEFANSEKFRSVRFTDNFGFSKASLSETGAVFAQEGEYSDDAHAEMKDVDFDDDDWDPACKLDVNDTIETGKTILEQAMETAEKQELGIETETDPVAEEARRIQKLYGPPSTIYYRGFNSWAHSAEWRLQLPPKEKTKCVASGGTFCAIASNRRILRIVRPSGLQEAPMYLPGPVLTMAAAESFLLVLYHRGEPDANGTQQIGYQLLDVGSEDRAGGNIPKVLTQGAMPVPVRSPKPISWVGFADRGMGLIPTAIDSKGMLLGLCHAANWGWVPLLDTNTVLTSVHNKLWPVSVQLNKLVAVSLKTPYPDIVPRPVLGSYELFIPLLGMDNEIGRLKYQLEESNLKDHIVLEQRKWASKKFCSDRGILDDGTKRSTYLLREKQLAQEEAKLDAQLVKQFILAIKLDRPIRALGLVRRLRLKKSIQIAMIQAQKHKADSSLTSRIEQVFLRREQEEEEEEEEESESEEEELEEEEQDNEDTKMETKPKAVRKPSKYAHAAEVDLSDSDSEDEKPLRVIPKKCTNHTRKRLSAPPSGFDSGNEALSDGEDNGNDVEEPVTPKKGPRNPFALKNGPAKSSKSDPKDISSFFKGVTSPIVTPKLNRQSTFSKEARLSASKRRKF